MATIDLRINMLEHENSNLKSKQENQETEMNQQDETIDLLQQKLQRYKGIIAKMEKQNEIIEKLNLSNQKLSEELDIAH